MSRNYSGVKLSLAKGDYPLVSSIACHCHPVPQSAIVKSLLHPQKKGNRDVLEIT